MLAIARSAATPPATSEGLPATTAAPAAAIPQFVAIREADGRRSQPIATAALTMGAVALDFGVHRAGARVCVRLWRIDGAVEAAAEPWFELHPRVRSDGLVPIGGLGIGDYRVGWVVDGRVVAKGTFAIGDGPMPRVALRAD
jgi:hypothetical protein